VGVTGPLRRYSLSLMKTLVRLAVGLVAFMLMMVLLLMVFGSRTGTVELTVILVLAAAAAYFLARRVSRSRSHP
jgi:hypothetical protein